MSDRIDRIRRTLELRLEAAWVEGGYGPGEPLHSPFCIEVGDWTVTGYWQTAKGDGWGNVRLKNGVECWRWQDDYVSPDDGKGTFFVVGSHEAIPPIPDEVVAYQATEYA